VKQKGTGVCHSDVHSAVAAAGAALCAIDKQDCVGSCEDTKATLFLY
jgi:D-arabinose 1-dehydrogenase-like Zn-dependent alcohol dehydrogenase